jgi:DNA replication protein DnaC
MSARIEPSYWDLMEFTNGKWDTIEDQKDRNRVYDACVRCLEQRQLEISWEELCPPAYRNTLSDKIPNLSKFEEVQKWKYGPTGLLIVGPTRRGKTRAAWKLLERLHFNERRSIIAFNPMDLKLAVAKAWRDPEEAECWIKRIRRVEVLFLDDLDTVKCTEAIEETIYDVFEFRPTHDKPVIATVNRTARELAARMNTNGRGAKIVERMREFCQVINFT